MGVVELTNSQIIFFICYIGSQTVSGNSFLCPIINSLVRILSVFQLISIENDKLGKLLPIHTDKGG